MKILKSVRTIAGNRLTNIDPGKTTTGGSGSNGHTHPNKPLLDSLSSENNYLKIDNTPVETHLLAEEW